jgi:hypothetical protein
MFSFQSCKFADFSEVVTEGLSIRHASRFTRMAHPQPSSACPRIYNSFSMKNLLLFALVLALAACSNKSNTAQTSSPSATPSKPPDAVQLKLQEYAGNSATNCGRLDIHAPEAQSKGAADCALEAGKAKRPFFIAYDMPGMAVGVAGTADGKLFTARSEGGGVSSGACPSELRLASSGRVTCFAPGDMGSMGAGHTAIPQGMPNPHALPKSKSE